MSRQGWWLTLRFPEPVSALAAALRGVGLLPVGQAWWFAWNSLEIVLPSRFADGSDPRLDADWDVMRFFSPRAEMRIGRRGPARACWLLLEEDPQTALGDLHGVWVEEARGGFGTEDGRHVLAGRKLRLPQGERRGEIIYPRPLDYDLGPDDLDQALVANIRAYYDEAHRLVTVRYAGIEHRSPDSTPVHPFPSAREVLNLAPSR